MTGHRANSGRRSAGVRVFSVSGMSMYPLYSDGDLVTGTDFSGTAVTGRCYGFTTENGKLLHRLVAVRRGRMIFSGDDSAGFETAALSDVFFAADISGPPIYNLTVRLLNELFFLRYGISGRTSKLKSAMVRAVYKSCFGGGAPWRQKKRMSNRN